MRVLYIDPGLSAKQRARIADVLGIVVVDESEAPVEGIRSVDPDAIDCAIVAVDAIDDRCPIEQVTARMEETPVIAVVPEAVPTIEAIEAGATDGIERSTVRARPSILVDRAIAAATRTRRSAVVRERATQDSGAKPRANEGCDSGNPVSAGPADSSGLDPGGPAPVASEGATERELLPLAGGVFASIVGAEDRRTLLRGLLEAFVSTPQWADGWYGQYDLAEATVRPAVTRGLDVEPFDPWEVGDEIGAIRRAIEQRTPQRCKDADGSTVLGIDDDSIAPTLVVPINDGAVIHGLCVLYAEPAREPTDPELDLIGLIGRTVGDVATAQQRRRALAARGEVELEVEHYADEAFLSRLSADDGSAVLESYEIDEDGRATMYYRTDADPDEAVRLADEAIEVETASVVFEGTEDLLLRAETVPETNFFELANAYGVSLTAATASDGVSRLVLAVPSDADVRETLNLLSEAIGEVELVAVREPTGDGTLAESPHETLRRTLTDRQYEVLLAAYHGGFYEWPRDNSSDEIADSLGISQPTLAQHLRTAERKTVEMLFDRSLVE